MDKTELQAILDKRLSWLRGAHLGGAYLSDPYLRVEDLWDTYRRGARTCSLRTVS